MSTSLVIDNKKMHSLESALKAVDYSRDYVTKLARDGKIIAAQMGRSWYIDLDSLKQYELVTNLEQEIKQKHISEDRRLERLVKTQTSDQSEKKQIALEKNLRQTKVSVAATFFLFLFSTVVLSGLAPTMIDGQTALLKKNSERNILATSHLIQNLTPALPQTTFAEDFETEFMAKPEEAIILLTDEMAQKMPFSDEVKIIKDESGKERIVPLDVTGEPLGSGVPFVTVPLNEVPVL